MREFFCFRGYIRPVDGFMSMGHNVNSFFTKKPI
jgi:hypothetical protein